jgi:hypothetical protein
MGEYSDSTQFLKDLLLASRTMQIPLVDQPGNWEVFLEELHEMLGRSERSEANRQQTTPSTTTDTSTVSTIATTSTMSTTSTDAMTATPVTTSTSASSDSMECLLTRLSSMKILSGQSCNSDSCPTPKIFLEAPI